MRKKDTCIIPLVMFYETKKPTKVYRVLSCVLYSIIENYFFVDYLCCHSKRLSFISYDKISKEASYNELLGIGIPEVLIDFISCHLFTKKNSTVILVCRYILVDYYLENGLVILVENSKQLSSVPNGLKLIIHLINKQKQLFYSVIHRNFLCIKHHDRIKGYSMEQEFCMTRLDLV